MAKDRLMIDYDVKLADGFSRFVQIVLRKVAVAKDDGRDGRSNLRGCDEIDQRTSHHHSFLLRPRLLS
jgi:hypothetical protein